MGPAGLGPQDRLPPSSDLQVLQILQFRHLLDLGFISNRDAQHLVPGQSGGEDEGVSSPFRPCTLPREEGGRWSRNPRLGLRALD